jgi:hypothetical protein
MAFRFLAVMIFGFLLLWGVKSLFDDRSRSGNVAEARPDVTTFSVRNTTYASPSSLPSRNFDPRAPKLSSGGPKPDEPESVSSAIMKVRLQQAGAAGLDRMVQFGSRPLEGNVNAPDPGLAESRAQPILTESFQAGQTEKIVTASTSPEPLLLPLPQERNASQPENVPVGSKAREASASVESLTQEQVAQIKSRLHDLGFLSLAKSSAWDTSARNALRDFKVANGLSNNDRWDLETSDKLHAQTAVHAGHSIIGHWSTAPCRSRKPTDTQLSITSRHTKSSAGSVCEFLDLKATARDWRVKASCSQGEKRWSASGKFALTGDKLTWTSERDVISYFRCN